MRTALGAGVMVLLARGVSQPLLIARTAWSLGPLLDVDVTMALRLASHLNLFSGVTVSVPLTSFAILFEETTVAELGPVLLEGVVGFELFW